MVQDVKEEDDEGSISTSNLPRGREPHRNFCDGDRLAVRGNHAEAESRP